MEMPFFPQADHSLKQNSIRSYHLREYKKLYGSKYSRLDNLSRNTVDYDCKKDTSMDYFKEKKHLSDSQDLGLLIESKMD